MITVNVEPVAKPRMSQRDRWAKRPAVVKYHKFCYDLRRELGDYEQGGQLDIEFHVEMPKSWSNKKKAEMLDKPHQQRPDLDNYIKAFLDALLDEDSHVWDIKATKYWSDEGKIIVNV